MPIRSSFLHPTFRNNSITFLKPKYEAEQRFLNKISRKKNTQQIMVDGKVILSGPVDEKSESNYHKFRLNWEQKTQQVIIRDLSPDSARLMLTAAFSALLILAEAAAAPNARLMPTAPPRGRLMPTAPPRGRLMPTAAPRGRLMHTAAAAAPNARLMPTAAPRGRLMPSPLKSFICPITMEMFKDPVLTSDGHTYERSAIEEWLEAGKRTSPLTNEAITQKLTPNHTLRQAICEWKEQNNVVTPSALSM